MQLEPFRFVEMIRDSKISKTIISKEYPLSRGQLDRWMDLEKESLLDPYKVLRVSKIIRMDPRIYFPGIENELKIDPEGIPAYVKPEIHQRIDELLDQLMIHNEEVVSEVRVEVKSLVYEMEKYRNTLISLKAKLKVLKDA